MLIHDAAYHPSPGQPRCNYALSDSTSQTISEVTCPTCLRNIIRVLSDQINSDAARISILRKIAGFKE